jgi:ABC-type transport system involved in cytochrome bd biosynthesis fused ATPase/permease subunit
MRRGDRLPILAPSTAQRHPQENTMERNGHGTQHLNDTLFALVLAAAAASAALLAWASADGGAGVPTVIAPAPVQLERVVLTAQREPLAITRRVELPRVVVSAKRLAPAAVKAVARASSVDRNS